MKNLYLLFIACLIIASGNPLNAQEEKSSKTAGIYILNIEMSDELTEEFVDVNRHTSKKGYSISTLLPDTLIKGINNAEVECIYKISKSGDQISTLGWGHVEGMPTNTYKGALSSTDKDYYIKIDLLIQTGGKAIFFGKGKWSKLKPRAVAYIKIFDDKKNEVYAKKVLIKDFSDLRSEEIARGILSVSSPAYLNPVDLYLIYKVTLMRLLGKE